jgi:hypothetical protein
MEMNDKERIAMLERENMQLGAQLLESQIGMLEATMAGCQLQLPMLHAQLRAVRARIAEAEKK